MTPFEKIILINLYLFAFSYMAHCFGLLDKRKTWVSVVLIVLASGTLGVIYFPMIFAEDIWNKLNKEEQQ